MMSTPTETAPNEFGLSTKFYKAYNNVPLAERKNVVVVIEGEPISWDMAYREIKQKTELGDKIVKKLMSLGFLER